MNISERRKILESLAAGQITVDAAEQLLAETAAPEDFMQRPSTERHSFRFLRIAVKEPGRDQVNVRIPLAWVGHSLSALGILPADLREKLSELTTVGIADDEQQPIVQMLREFYVNVNPGDKRDVHISLE